MAAKELLTFACVSSFVSCCVLGFPNSGISMCLITLESTSCNVTHAMFSEGWVSLTITLRHDVEEAIVRYTVEKQCSAGERCSKEVSIAGMNGTEVPNIEPMESTCILAKNKHTQGDSTEAPGDGSTTENPTEASGNGTSERNSTEVNTKSDTPTADGGGGTKEDSGGKKDDSSQILPPAIVQLAEDGIYMVKIDVIMSAQKKERKDSNTNDSILLEVHIIMENPLGYLDAADYPYLVFYSLMFVGYFFLGIIWSICMCCFYKNLIRLQLFIGVAILLGFAEKLFYVVEYGYVNTTGSRYTDSTIPLLIIAEGISAGKKTFARVLLIIISSGFGTIKPQLGSLLWWVFTFGVVFFVVTYADGFVRQYYYTPLEGFNVNTLITGSVLMILNTVFVFWIVSSLIPTKRTLKENNDHRLNTYNNFYYTLVVIAVGILAFLLWIFITGFIDSCTQDWRGFWLRECFWPLLFTLLLVVIMILWRPSSKSNTGKVVYTAVPRGETVEMAIKDNFETMRMRRGSKSEGLPLNSDSEEDVIFFQ